jgi:hypothetical protein
MTTEESSLVVAVSARVTAALFWSSRIVTSPNWSASTCLRLSVPSRFATWSVTVTLSLPVPFTAMS